jgi:dephospho-CoA kinase
MKRPASPKNPDPSGMTIRKPIIGLAGGIGSGKSEVARILENLGAAVISSDALNRQELENNEVKATLVNWWGPGVLHKDGTVDRRAVSRIVFSKEAERSRLEALTHPRIAQHRLRLIEQFQRDPAVRMIVIDSPLLYETELDRLCDSVVFVDADVGVRCARVRASRGWSPEELERREKLQRPLDFKKARADHICVNNSDLGALRRTVEAIYSRIVSGAGSDDIMRR